MGHKLFTVKLPNFSHSIQLEFVTQKNEKMPIVFLHGIHSGAESWQYQFQSLNETADCYAWNMPGYGHSDLYLTKPLAKDYARLLEAWVVTQPFNRFILVGHSLGALIAHHYAHLYPERLYSLMLVSATRGYGDTSQSEQETIAQLRPNMMRSMKKEDYIAIQLNRLAKTLDDKKLVIVRAAIDQITYPGLVASSHLLAHSSLNSDAVINIRPFFTLCGTQDEITRYSEVKELSEIIKSEFIPIEQATHPCYLEQEVIFNQHLAHFIRLTKELHNVQA